MSKPQLRSPLSTISNSSLSIEPLSADAKLNGTALDKTVPLPTGLVVGNPTLRRSDVLCGRAKRPLVGQLSANSLSRHLPLLS